VDGGADADGDGVMGSTLNFARAANCGAGFKLATADAIAREPSKGLKVGANGDSGHA
jgi:hypothetical protein